jgi:hypothetical protein
MHKTGTTSIQQALLDRRDALLASGVYVPLAGARVGRAGHHEFARDVDSADHPGVFGRIARQLYVEVQHVDQRQVVISSEELCRTNFSASKAAELRQLADTLNRRLVVVAFVREYVSNLNSAYVQQIKTLSHGLDFEEYLSRERGKRRWSYSAVLRPFEQVNAKLVVKKYEGNTTLTFFDLLGMKIEGEQRRANSSIGPWTVEAYRILIHYLRAFAKQSPKKARVQSGHIRDTADKLGWNEDQYWGFSFEKASALHHNLSQVDEPFLDRFGIAFTPPPERVANDISYLTMSKDDRKRFNEGIGAMVANRREAKLLDEKRKFAHATRITEVQSQVEA